MEPIALSGIVLVCVFGGALVGVLLRHRLPDHHLSEASKDTVKLATGVIATMAALVGSCPCRRPRVRSTG